MEGKGGGGVKISGCVLTPLLRLGKGVVTIRRGLNLRNKELQVKENILKAI